MSFHKALGNDGFLRCTGKTRMFQRARYDRYDPRLLEQMYGSPENDLSYHPSTIVQNYLETLNWEVLPHPAYSPDLARAPCLCVNLSITTQLTHRHRKRDAKYMSSKVSSTSVNVNSQRSRMRIRSIRFTACN
ncbi:hypothetical protein ALC53_07115 [Atta colombica]|uniref:Histone-lysine N-methyltransferase SETMAR n=1 Tax=Atta colombica TaxID=520822 RepID=A0A151I343_9HYME|nr:hypothetical protein ALC53_07115 [Atta colombica]